MYVLTKNLQLRLLFKDVINLFLYAAALFPKDHAKDQDTLIEQSLICINGSVTLNYKISQVFSIQKSHSLFPCFLEH